MSATVFDTPLDARSLVEASAGTGKTYALAGLFARAVIAQRLQVPQILAVTYTVAATQELHERVRLRLQRASQLTLDWRDEDQAGDDAETTLLRRLLRDALRGEALPALRLRLQRAVRDLDLAAITTIHGFCQRLLTEHALLAGQPLLRTDIEPGNAAQRSRLAVALWRAHARTGQGADFLRRTFRDVDGLADALRDLLPLEPLLPPPPADGANALRDATWRTLRAQFLAHGDDDLETLRSASARRILKSGKQALQYEALWQWFAAQSDAAPFPHDDLPCLTRAGLVDCCPPTKQAMAPALAISDAVQAFVSASESVDLHVLHALRDDARREDQAIKRDANVRDFDDLVDAVFAALEDPLVAPALIEALRAQFPLVLVDEFQDTDARQWTIFSRLFGEGGLLLVGDPKQAIYRFRGGDVQTYLDARATARLAAPLDRNFRSRPCVLDAVNALFDASPSAHDMLGDGIAFAATQPGGGACDPDLMIDGAPAPALVLQALPPKAKGTWTAQESIDLAAGACARAIRDLLVRARDGQATRRDGDVQRPIEARDCAVLVRSHREGLAIRDALTKLGVPAVSAGRGSLYETDEAQQLLALLLALSTPGDERRLRAVLATPLFGYDAALLQALEDDGDQRRRWQQELADWRLRWESHGPQPMLADVLARQAARMLAFADGERRITHLLQLGEQLQEARARRLGPQGQVDWLRAAIAHADREDETQWPNLESDASRVQILTLHKSKGLEFPLVFLPFAGIGRTNGGKARVVQYHDANGQRVRQWKTDERHPGAPAWDDACAAARREDAAEDMRLLYVGLTRARDAMWIATGALASNAQSSLHRLFGGVLPRADLLGGNLVVRAPDASADDTRLPPSIPDAIPAPRTPHRRLRRDWWIHSFSQLHRQHAHGAQALAEEAPADDERPLAVFEDIDPALLRFSGTRFGNALHHALEHVDFAAWRDATDAPEDQRAFLCDALRSQDYPESDFDAGVRELAPLIARTLNAPLPEGVRLCDVADAARVAELEFHFTLADADVPTLLALLQRHGIATGRRDFGTWPKLSGLMTGKIDLTYRVDGRVYVVDYKSNRLPAWDAAALAQAMSASEYDLQALLYAVAVHRWLRMRLGNREAAASAFGGVRYLFCRGLDAGDPQRGVAIPALTHDLIHAVDDLLGGAA
ncbi:Exodeoxyribonuclease V beta chain [Lysobacter dokdonensis DS-58]|uniref:RecBCD enzyme subunit RecB n=1 Tax=Lysobacter dokdonensis DS-58 TaxID=1300345 RepID=A0A0A2WI22_9GAMM|nr:exodeoxyribonuclease V subunit beta [Lysobacter dokdonensis]KGQ18357.1 Exodeoxyribonuclease V beta chain [Lysobacter dokdonensis DS-58]